MAPNCCKRIKYCCTEIFCKYIMRIGQIFNRKFGNRCAFFYFKLKICQNFAVEFCEYKIPGTLPISISFYCIFLPGFVSGLFFFVYPSFLSLGFLSAIRKGPTFMDKYSSTYQTLLNSILGPTLMNQH